MHVYVCGVCVCVHVYVMCAVCVPRAFSCQTKHLLSETSYRWLWATRYRWQKLNPGPLFKQQVLLTAEPCLQFLYTLKKKRIRIHFSNQIDILAYYYFNTIRPLQWSLNVLLKFIFLNDFLKKYPSMYTRKGEKKTSFH